MPVPELSPTEERVAFLSARGQTDREIADTMGVTLRTIEWHLARARRKLARAVELHDRIHRAEPEAPQKGEGA